MSARVQAQAQKSVFALLCVDNGKRCVAAMRIFCREGYAIFHSLERSKSPACATAKQRTRTCASKAVGRADI